MSLTNVSYAMIKGEVFNVLDFMPKGHVTATTDCAPYIQAAVDARNGFSGIYFPAGEYLINSTINFVYDRYLVYGDGVASRINFMPSANDDCFLFDKADATPSVQNTIRDLAFFSWDTTYDKRAITVVDISENVIDNIQTIYPHWSGGSNYSTFLWIQGRDLTSVRNLNVFADQPIRISPIPAPHTAANIGIDHFHFSDCYLGCMDAAKSIVQIDSDTDVTYVTFDGYQAWIGGNFGLYWYDTENTGTSLGLTLRNIRWEQEQGTTGYFVYIRHNQQLQQLTLDNLYGGSETNGFYFFNVNKINMKQILYVGSKIGISANASSTFIDFNNVFINNPSATVSILSEQNSGTYWVGGNAYTFLPNSTTGGLSQSINPEPNNGYTRLAPTKFTVANTVVQKLCENNVYSTLIVNAGSVGASAIYQIRGTNNATVLISTSDAGIFGATVGAQTINVYWDGAQYVIQNITGSSVIFSVVAIG
jgi:hypothetical protein